MHTAEPLVSEPSSFEAKIATEKRKRYKPPGNDQIPAKPIQTGGNRLHSVTHKITTSILNKEGFPQQWNEAIIVHIYKK
jgi:hypothetical protein